MAVKIIVTLDPLLTYTVYLIPTTIVFYDYLLSFEREVRHIWRRGFSGSTTLFYIARYSAFFNIVCNMLDLTPWRGMSDKSCSIVTRIQMVLDLSLLIASAVFSGLRAYALSGRRRSVLIVAMTLGLVNPALVLFTFVNTVTIMIDATPAFRGCGYYSNISDLSYENWTLGARLSSMLADLLVLVVTWVRMWPANGDFAPVGIAGKLTWVLMRDGTMYFLVLLIGNLIGLVFIRQISLVEPSSTWISALTAVMTWRFVLDLHQADDALRDGTSGTAGAYQADVTAQLGSMPVFRTSALDHATDVYGAVIADANQVEDEREQWGLAGGSAYDDRGD